MSLADVRLALADLTFKGEPSEKIDVFFKDFEHQKRHFSWTSVNSLYHLRVCLKDSAKEEFDRVLGSVDDNYENMKSQLQKAFSPDWPKLKKIFYEFVQKEDMKLIDYFSEKLRLGKEAGLPMEDILVNLFLHMLARDKEHFHETNHANLSEVQRTVNYLSEYRAEYGEESLIEKRVNELKRIVDRHELRFGDLDIQNQGVRVHLLQLDQAMELLSCMVNSNRMDQAQVNDQFSRLIANLVSTTDALDTKLAEGFREIGQLWSSTENNSKRINKLDTRVKRQNMSINELGNRVSVNHAANANNLQQLEQKIAQAGENYRTQGQALQSNLDFFKVRQERQDGRICETIEALNAMKLANNNGLENIRNKMDGMHTRIDGVQISQQQAEQQIQEKLQQLRSVLVEMQANAAQQPERQRGASGFVSSAIQLATAIAGLHPVMKTGIKFAKLFM